PSMFEYDAAGETTKITDAAGNATQLQYDFLGRKIVTIAADATKQTTTFDMLGRPIAQQQLSSGGAILASKSATLDPAGHTIAATDARGNTTSFTYDRT